VGSGGLALLTLPAVIDALRDARATLSLDDDGAVLVERPAGAGRAAPRIAEVRLATTLDFSQRATVRLDSGERLRIPPECLPPGRASMRRLPPGACRTGGASSASDAAVAPIRAKRARLKSERDRP
jgi:hypothetical protein